MIRIEHISKSYPESNRTGSPALKDTSLTIPSGKTTVLLGASGCGKSTLLRIVLGLLPPDTGNVFIDDQPMTPSSAQELRHKIGYVIQDGGLFPHLTIKANIQLAARYLKVPAGKLADRTRELCHLTQINESLLERYPADLSGGQRQRVGIMRALMLDPPTLLMDEPLGALDPITRAELQDELKAIFSQFSKTVVLVTHDLSEAAYLGDSISLMQDGAILQSGTMRDLSENPSDEYVTRFLQAQERGTAKASEEAGTDSGKKAGSR